MSLDAHFATLFEEQRDALIPLRKEAWNRFLHLGFPTQKKEAFQYVKMRRLADPLPLATFSNDIFDGDLIFVNGHYVQTPSPFLVLSLEEAERRFSTLFKGSWTQELEKEQDPFAALNGALQPNGAFLYIPPKTILSSPLRITHYRTGSLASMAMPRLHIFVGSFSEVSIHMETVGDTPIAVNQVITLSLDEGARLKMANIHEKPHPTWHFEALRASLKRDSFLQVTTLNHGGPASRFSSSVHLLQKGAEASLSSLSLLHDKNESHAHVFINHAAPSCRSNQLFKSVLHDTSHSSFEGKIYVEKIAQKTEAFQLNNNLLLSPHTQAESKPNLEIFADDVKASHGATFGALDPDHIFYLQSRGLTKFLAEKLLITGFCEEVTELLDV